MESPCIKRLACTTTRPLHQGQRQPVCSPGQNLEPGWDEDRNPVWHQLSTQPHLQVNSFDHTPIHVLDLTAYRPNINSTWRRQQFILPFRDWTWLTGNSPIPEQPDPGIHGVRICPLQHSHLGGASRPCLQSCQEIQEVNLEKKQVGNQIYLLKTRRRTEETGIESRGEPKTPEGSWEKKPGN